MYATGALNLSVRGYGPLTSFPVSDRSVTRGEYESPKSTVPSSAILVGSVAAERSYGGLGTLVPKFSILGGGGGGGSSLLDLGPMLVPMSFLLIIVPIPFLVGSFVLSRIPCFVPKRRSQRGVVVSRA